MTYNDSLDVTLHDLKKLSVKTMELNECHVNMYSWVVDGGGDYGMSWLGAACKVGTGEKSKTTLVRGPSRYHGVIETAEVKLKYVKFYISRCTLYDLIYSWTY